MEIESNFIISIISNLKNKLSPWGGLRSETKYLIKKGIKEITKKILVKCVTKCFLGSIFSPISSSAKKIFDMPPGVDELIEVAKSNFPYFLYINDTHIIEVIISKTKIKKLPDHLVKFIKKLESILEPR